MLLEAIHHEPKSALAYAYDEETLHIRVRTKKNDMDHVFLQYGDKYNMKDYSAEVEMHRFASDDLFDFYQAEIKPHFKRASYAFRFEKGETSIWLTENGFQEEDPIYSGGKFEFPFLNAVDVFQPPAWVKDAVFYQIFPERFANGDPTNDPEQVEPWGGKPRPDNFFGGDLQGVIDNIDYLKTLGINALYFTPLFEATSNHKYDTIDYLKVDEHFGDNELLKELVTICHKNGIKIVLDAVFNHAGYYFPPFQDVVNNGEKSKYKDWFYIKEFPIQTEPLPNYHTFAFTHMMPKFNTENPEVKEYLLELARYWIEEIGIDGWRLDVANEVDHHFWREFRSVVKEANPEAYILGEIWHDSYPWLMGDQFDAVMNYPITNAILDFFCTGKTTASQFSMAVDRMHATYPLSVHEVNFNLLGSHDTARLLTICNGDKRRMKQALTFMFTYLGTPCIYYGDEVGIDGDDDPDCRKTMIWDEDEQDQDLLSFYQQLIALRKRYRALRDGRFTFLELASENIIGYKREAEGEQFIILLDGGGEGEELSLQVNATQVINQQTNDLLEVEDGRLTVSLKPFESKILHLKN